MKMTVHEKNAQLELPDVTRLLKRLEMNNFNGVITIRYQDGKIVLIEELKKIKFNHQIA
jgi:hypothetical protein